MNWAWNAKHDNLFNFTYLQLCLFSDDFSYCSQPKTTPPPPNTLISHRINLLLLTNPFKTTSITYNRSSRRLLDGSSRQLTVLTATTPQDTDKSQCSPSNENITNSSQQNNQTQQPVHPMTPSSCLAIRRPTTNMLVFSSFFSIFYLNVLT